MNMAKHTLEYKFISVGTLTHWDNFTLSFIHLCIGTKAHIYTYKYMCVCLQNVNILVYMCLWIMIDRHRSIQLFLPKFFLGKAQKTKTKTKNPMH